MSIRTAKGSILRPGWKSALDITCILLSLPVWLPVMTLVALWVAVTSPGPIFYRQPRVGFKGRRFMLVKFRTMKVNAETQVHEAYLEHLIVSDRPMIKLDATGDPRLIRGGKLLRATGLDELPQVFNVLRGEMSLVGPRPFFPGDLADYERHHFERLHVLPGITGLWQISGRSDVVDFEEVVRLDREYIENWSVFTDISILFRTLPAALGRGAY